jgi:ferredoxin
MDGDGLARVDASACTECGVCVDECPVEAISMA